MILMFIRILEKTSKFYKFFITRFLILNSSKTLSVNKESV